MYYIYHIPGIKIGCTNDLIKRMADQGFTEWEILEKYRNIYTASKREIELQKEYGLPVDRMPYYMVVQHRKKAAVSGGKKGGIKGGKINGKKNRIITFEQAQEIRAKYTAAPRQQTLLGKEYGVTSGVIFNIVHNKTHLEP